MRPLAPGSGAVRRTDGEGCCLLLSISLFLFFQTAQPQGERAARDPDGGCRRATVPPTARYGPPGGAQRVVVIVDLSSAGWSRLPSLLNSLKKSVFEGLFSLALWKLVLVG
jgi:hypothetical protein